MAHTPVSLPAYEGVSRPSIENEAHSSGVSWSAVIGGAFVTAALSLILLALGTGLGFESVSPWSNVGASASTIGKASIVWLIVLEIIASSMGGYLAGRLRTKWAGIHTDEVYFRDTAHGFLAWSVALVVTAAFLATAATSLAGSSMETSKSAVSTQSEPANAYFVDSLFRADGTKSDATSTHAEAAVIFAKALGAGEMSATDKSYLSQLVAANTGMNRSDADRRVTEVFGNAQQAADVTRKAIAHSLLWIFVSLLIGAFCASLAATIGGRQRDNVVLV
jgi:hypothetical protein